MILALALQTSLLVRPVYDDPEPPELRAARAIVLIHDEVPGASGKGLRSLEDTQKLAADLQQKLADGASFADLAMQFDESPHRKLGSHLGAFPQGIFAPAIDSFLFAAEMGAVSGPLSTARGLHLVQRVEAYAGVKQVAFQGDLASARAREFHVRLAAGEDFEKLLVEAREGGAEIFGQATGEAILVRGWQDKMLKALAFETPVGEVAVPMQTPFGWHVVQRVPHDSLPKEALEPVWIKATACLLNWRGNLGADAELDRSRERAFELASQIFQFVTERGDSFDDYAKEWTDDPGGRERAGSLGWIYRHHPDLPVLILNLFRSPVGELQRPLESTAGFVLLRRDL